MASGIVDNPVSARSLVPVAGIAGDARAGEVPQLLSMIITFQIAMRSGQ